MATKQRATRSADAVDVSGGRATADAIMGAELVVIEGMGHNLPRALWPGIASLIANLVQRVEAGTSGE